jgi:hypothetical protein
MGEIPREVDMKRAGRGTILAVAALACALGGTTGGEAQEKAPPAATFEPATVDFGDVVAGKPSAPVRVTVTNTGDSDLYVRSVAIEGDERGDFALTGDRCTGGTIKAGKSCVLDVVMTPAATGPRSASLAFSDNAGTRTLALQGNGINSAAVPPH